MIAGTAFNMIRRHDSALRRGLDAFGAGLAMAALVSIAVAQQPGAPLAPGAPPSAQVQPPAGPPPVIYAQPPGPQPAPASPSSSILPTPSDVISGIGRIIDQSIANVKGAGETLGGVPGVAGDFARGVGDAAGSIARLPGTNVVKGFEKCPLAPNGAPDCEVASVALCKTKGYQLGRSLDITSAHKCPPQMWREGRQPNDAECKQESFVSQALCQ